MPSQYGKDGRCINCAELRSFHFVGHFKCDLCGFEKTMNATSEVSGFGMAVREADSHKLVCPARRRQHECQPECVGA